MNWFEDMVWDPAVTEADLEAVEAICGTSRLTAEIRRLRAWIASRANPAHGGPHKDCGLWVCRALRGEHVTTESTDS